MVPEEVAVAVAVALADVDALAVAVLDFDDDSDVVAVDAAELNIDDVSVEDAVVVADEVKEEEADDVPVDPALDVEAVDDALDVPLDDWVPLAVVDTEAEAVLDPVDVLLLPRDTDAVEVPVLLHVTDAVDDAVLLSVEVPDEVPVDDTDVVTAPVQTPPDTEMTMAESPLPRPIVIPVAILFSTRETAASRLDAGTDPSKTARKVTTCVVERADLRSRAGAACRRRRLPSNETSMNSIKASGSPACSRSWVTATISVDFAAADMSM